MGSRRFEMAQSDDVIRNRQVGNGTFSLILTVAVCGVAVACIAWIIISLYLPYTADRIERDFASSSSHGSYNISLSAPGAATGKPFIDFKSNDHTEAAVASAMVVGKEIDAAIVRVRRNHAETLSTLSDVSNQWIKTPGKIDIENPWKIQTPFTSR